MPNYTQLPFSEAVSFPGGGPNISSNWECQLFNNIWWGSIIICIFLQLHMRNKCRKIPKYGGRGIWCKNSSIFIVINQEERLLCWWLFKILEHICRTVLGINRWAGVGHIHRRVEDLLNRRQPLLTVHSYGYFIRNNSHYVHWGLVPGKCLWDCSLKDLFLTMCSY